MLNDFGEVLFDANLTNYNTYGINTSAKYLIKPTSQELLKELIIYLKKENINNMCFSNFIAALTSIPIFLIIFLPIYFIIGENLIVNIILMLITIIICEFIAYKITDIKNLKLENVTILLVIIVYTIFGILTYYPPNNYLFFELDPSVCGIQK